MTNLKNVKSNLCNRKNSPIEMLKAKYVLDVLTGYGDENRGRGKSKEKKTRGKPFENRFHWSQKQNLREGNL